MDVCPLCNTTRMIVELGSLVCTNCGHENFSNVFTTDQAYTPYSIPISGPASYTRVKRFKKYLQRAAMNQSASTIPRDTWDYLLAGQPYRGPGNIVRRLKSPEACPEEVLRFVADARETAVPTHQCADP